MTTRTPRVLVGSSSEGLPYARALQVLVAPDVETSLWNNELFVPGEYPVESLETAGRKFDGSVIVATADDRVISRGTEASAPRDNLLFEFGMFVACFGRKRALLMVESLSTTKLPSDVSGLTVIPFMKTDPPPEGLTSAADSLKTRAIAWRDRAPVEPEVVERLNRVLRLSLSDVHDRSGFASDIGLHVFLVDSRTDPAQLVRVSRARSNPKPPRTWPPFQKGSGVVGWCWETASSVFANLTAPPLSTVSAGEFSQLTDAQRMGMNFELLESSRQRYKCVGAVPITTIVSGGEFLGCVSYNLGVASQGEVEVLRANAVERVLDSCAEMVAIIIEH